LRTAFHPARPGAAAGNPLAFDEKQPLQGVADRAGRIPAQIIGLPALPFKKGSVEEKRGFFALHKERQSTCHNLHVRVPCLGSNQRRRPFRMSPDVNLSELEARHRALEDEISEALAHPSTDDMKIAELKRRKLHVKDEIARLRHDYSASIH
jgi:hypothetical protein